MVPLRTLKFFVEPKSILLLHGFEDPFVLVRANIEDYSAFD